MLELELGETTRKRQILVIFEVWKRPLGHVSLSLFSLILWGTKEEKLKATQGKKFRHLPRMTHLVYLSGIWVHRWNCIITELVSKQSREVGGICVHGYSWSRLCLALFIVEFGEKFHCVVFSTFKFYAQICLKMKKKR